MSTISGSKPQVEEPKTARAKLRVVNKNRKRGGPDRNIYEEVKEAKNATISRKPKDLKETNFILEAIASHFLFASIM